MSGVLEIHHLDVGIGDATVVTFRDVIKQDGAEDKVVFRSCTVIDGGRSTLGGETLAWYLRTIGISRVDTLICTHIDADHVEGLTYLLSNTELCDARTVVYDNGHTIGKKRETFVKAAGKRLKVITAGTKLYLNRDGSTTRPYPYIKCKFSENIGNDTNDCSIACLIKYENFRYYTAGDLPSDVEEEGIYDKHVCAFKAGHHGARTSTSKPFLKNKTPTVALISAGEQHDHPHQETITRLYKAQSVKAIFLTNCYYKRSGVDPSAPLLDKEGTARSNKAIVAGGEHYLGNIVLRVSQEDALNERFKLLYWQMNTAPSTSTGTPGSSKLGSTRMMSVKCGAAPEFGQPPKTSEFERYEKFLFRSGAKLKHLEQTVSETLKAWARQDEDEEDEEDVVMDAQSTTALPLPGWVKEVKDKKKYSTENRFQLVYTKKQGRKKAEPSGTPSSSDAPRYKPYGPKPSSSTLKGLSSTELKELEADMNMSGGKCPGCCKATSRYDRLYACLSCRAQVHYHRRCAGVKALRCPDCKCDTPLKQMR
jgi:beta-lactamase superfamily II metal-dependent hydrolase